MEPKRVTTLDDLADLTVDVSLKRPDGGTLVVALKVLTEEQVWTIRRGTRWPKPPVIEMSKTGPIYDYKDEAYQRTVEDTNRAFARKMLLASLPFTVTGETEDEQLAAFSARIGEYLYDQLVAASQRINVITPEEIAALADSFRPHANGGAPAVRGAGLEPERLAAPAAG